VETQLRAAGVQPTWYVDKPSVPQYRAVGLTVVEGGKLVPARNMALRKAKKQGKVCVQISDDISKWNYCQGEVNRQRTLEAANKAGHEAATLRISPLAAARFIVAKMRSVPEGQKRPMLGGVFYNSNHGQSFMTDAFTVDNFILGDFFVQEPSSPCLFDPRMTLKEDYDFTCSHLAKHGAILRCNRMMIQAAHETNAGGAVSERDEAGTKERKNIAILQEKWPGVFRTGKRGDTQVVMNWKWRKF